MAEFRIPVTELCDILCDPPESDWQELCDILSNNGYSIDEPEVQNMINIDGFADAAVGVTEDYRLVYSYDKLVEVCMEKYGETYSEACDHVSYDVVRMVSYLSGTGVPIIMNDLRREGSGVTD